MKQTGIWLDPELLVESLLDLAREADANAPSKILLGPLETEQPFDWTQLQFKHCISEAASCLELLGGLAGYLGSEEAVDCIVDVCVTVCVLFDSFKAV